MYVLTPEGTPALAPQRGGLAPLLTLDDKAYKLVQQLEAATTGGVPSLVQANRVTITGQSARQSALRGVGSEADRQTLLGTHLASPVANLDLTFLSPWLWCLVFRCLCAVVVL